MRKLRPSVASSTYQHRVVFQYHGVPPLAWWDEWEVLADQRYPRGSVQVIDFRSRNLSHKRRRKKNANCIKCGLLVHQRYDGWCKDCVDIEQKAKENMEKIFDPFFTTKDIGVGTGQGLHLVHGFIVNHHKGSLSLETKVGEGTTFFIYLPLNAD